jgi:TPP-dependent pyruvate/acetoin dehydrogenase alpha subunit
MDAATFFAAVRRRTRATSTARDPLTEARHFLEQHGDTAEAQALRKVIKALAAKEGEFSESEVWLFGTEAITLVAALVDARIEERYSEIEWWAV